MARVTVEDCLDKVPTRYDLIILAAKRARQLATGGTKATLEWEDENLEVLAEHRMTPGKATIYNTMHWHRVFNFTGWNRLVISAAIREDIQEVFDLYKSDKLFK